VERLPGEHLHMVVDPVGVARGLMTLAERSGMVFPKYPRSDSNRH